MAGNQYQKAPKRPVLSRGLSLRLSLCLGLGIFGLTGFSGSELLAVNLQWSTVDVGLYAGYSWNRYNPATLEIIENPKTGGDASHAVARTLRRAEQNGGAQYRTLTARPVGMEARWQLGGRWHRLTTVFDTEFLFLRQTYTDFTLGIGWQGNLDKVSSFALEFGMDVLGMVGFIGCIAIAVDDSYQSDRCPWLDTGNKSDAQNDADSGYLTRFLFQATYRRSLAGALSVFTRVRYTFRSPEVNAWFTHPFRHSTALYFGSSIHW